ncbi:MAG: sodium:proton exchanger [Deltaproteobacteria bacterium SG8_13]|nr:MAG: sodium:proton exchanger [Deltaproteobacteria bacterium SG8_13]
MLLPVIYLILGLVLLIKGADFLVDGAVSIARRLQISDLVIGLTVVAFGTSTPELFVNLLASFKGTTGIAVGNIVGSNIANIFLILGVCALIHPLSVSRGTVWKGIPFSLLAVIVLAITTNDPLLDATGPAVISRGDGLVLLSFFIIFLYYSFDVATEVPGLDSHTPAKKHRLSVSLLLTAGGLVSLSLGGKWIVDGAAAIALQLGMSEVVVGLTIVAIGTSLPELATSAVAVRRGNVEIAVGNVVGSNIFNIFLVLGISATVKPLPFPAGGNLDIMVVIAASLLLFLFMFTGLRRSLDRWEGAIFVIMYAAYIAYRVWAA